MERSIDKQEWQEISPPWYLSVLIGFGLSATYLLSTITWLWWKTGEYAFRLSREMREALWHRHQELRGLVEVEEPKPQKKGGVSH